MLVAPCTHCHQPCGVAEEHLGASVQCPNCGGIFNAPPGSACAAPPEAPPVQPTIGATFGASQLASPRPIATNDSRNFFGFAIVGVAAAAGVLCAAAIVLLVVWQRGSSAASDVAIAAPVAAEVNTVAGPEENGAAIAAPNNSPSAPSGGEKADDSDRLPGVGELVAAVEALADEAAAVENDRAPNDPPQVDANPQNELPVEAPNPQAPPRNEKAIAADEKAVLDCWAAYTQSLVDRDGEAAARCVDAATFEWYEEHKRRALTFSAVRVKALPVLDRLMVLVLRHRVPLVDLRKMSGRELFIHSVKEGWTSESSATSVKITSAEVNGDTARAPLVRLIGDPVYVNFYREKDGWKLALAEMSKLGAEAMERLVDRPGRDGNAFLLQLVERASGRGVDPKIWDPPE